MGALGETLAHAIYIANLVRIAKASLECCKVEMCGPVCVILQIHDLLGGDKQLAEEILHDLKQDAEKAKQSAAPPAGQQIS